MSSGLINSAIAPSEFGISMKFEFVITRPSFTSPSIAGIRPACKPNCKALVKPSASPHSRPRTTLSRIGIMPRLNPFTPGSRIRQGRILIPLKITGFRFAELVEVWGFEPQASSLRTTRSTN